MRLLPGFVVDLLPVDWWRPDNFHFLGNHTLHFCSEGVRTIELDYREVARGRKPFPYGRWD